MPRRTGFGFETLGPIEEKVLFLLSFVPKALVLALALPLNQGKQMRELYMQALTSHTSCAANSSFSRLGPSRVTFPSTSLRNSINAIGYTYVASALAISFLCKYENPPSLVTTSWRQGTIPPSGESVWVVAIDGRG